MKNALQTIKHNYTLATAADLAERILQADTGETIEFTVENIMLLLPWETPEKHYIQKRDYFRDHVIIAGRENGGYTKISTIAELLPPERDKPQLWDFISFIQKYFYHFGVNRVAIIEN